MGIAPLLLLAQAFVWGARGGAAERPEVLCAGDACYTLHRGKLAWSGAQERCESNGGNLATIRSSEEAERVQELLGRSQAGAGWQGKVWIGLSLEKGKCVQAHDPLRGFAWAAGGEKTNYSAWLAEPHTTCLSHRCASLQPAGPSSPAGWADGPCRTPLPGYVCKFSFQGMCGPLPLAGPGAVTYRTPFGVESEQLAAAPFGTLAQVTCGAGGLAEQRFALCKERLPAGGFAWHPRGPLCAAGCAHRNGGCQQECLEEGPGAPPRCACRAGYALAADLVSCEPVDGCRPNPCEGPCRGLPGGGFECSCPAGYGLAPDGRRCLDVDECLGQPCHQECRNTAGSFACACRPGYEPEAPGSSRCRDVDECAGGGGGGCPQLCLNVPGSFLCACRPGYQRDALQDACVDVDECLRAPCPGACLNVPGSFRCSCPPGFEPGPDGVACHTTSPPATPRSSRPPATTAERSTGSPVSPAGATQQPAPTEAAGREGQHAADGPRLLLYYILGSLVAILLLVAFALALLVYRRRRAKKEKQQAKSAADDYRWVPEQAESRAAGGEFR